jgi:hypothetical protein
MEILAAVLNLYYNHLIKSIFISLLLIILVRQFFKKVDTETAITIIKWILIVYSAGVILRLMIFAIFFIQSGDFSVFSERAIGPYWYVYSLIILVSILPLLLLNNKLANKTFFILFLTIFINIGWLFELVIIHFANIQGDNINSANFPDSGELFILIKGLTFGVILLVIGNLINSNKNKDRLINNSL